MGLNGEKHSIGTMVETQQPAGIENGVQGARNKLDVLSRHRATLHAKLDMCKSINRNPTQQSAVIELNREKHSIERWWTLNNQKGLRMGLKEQGTSSTCCLDTELLRAPNSICTNQSIATQPNNQQ
eukprot:11527272-Ditylum_brightwellii.AAC.1